MNEFAERLSRVASQLPDDTTAALVTSQINRYYLTGLNIDSGFLLITKKSCSFGTDFRYIETAQNTLSGVCDAVMFKNSTETLSELLRRDGIENILIERSVITLSGAHFFEKHLAPVRLLTNSPALDDMLASMRMNKSAAELEKIRAAQTVAEASFRHILGYVKEGVSERDIALELEFDMRRRGAERVAFDLIVAAGANGSMPHAVPTDYKVTPGDFVTIDMGAVVDGYHSDMTRTFAVGEVSEEQRKVYNIVLQAQLAGVEYLTSGKTDCREADAVARKIITDAGYGDCFGHSLGHSVGLEIHEMPSLSTKSSAILTSGCVVTCEPGIYIPGRFGVRIEDMLYITEDSAINLTSVPKELIIL